MLHPVGSRPPAVYWRRRLLLFGCVVVVILLIVLTVRVLLSGGGHSGAAAGSTTSSSVPPATHAATSQRPTPTQHASSVTATNTPTTPTTRAATTPPPAPAKCTAGQLALAAAVGKSSYSVGDQPLVMLQVTNDGPKPCVQNLADSQVVLTIYNGASRVWGSHDCKIEPGTTDRTLAVNQPVRVSIVWSGLSSQPNCAGTRQRVGAGTYTLYAELAGHRGKAAQFSIS